MQNKENFPFINKSQTKVIISQLEKCICKIIKDIGNTGTGFFCKIPYPDQFHFLPVLITNNHVLGENNLKQYCNIRFTINDDNIEKNIFIDNSRLIFTDEEIDITIIEIKPFDKIIHFLDIDDDILIGEEKNNNSYGNELIYILQYPKGQKASHSVGKIKDILDFNINNYCYTDFGSSGSPILLLSKFKLIAVHKERTKFNFNRGTFIKIAIDKFNSQKQIVTKPTNIINYQSLKEQEFKYLQDLANNRIDSIQFTRLMNNLYSNNHNDKNKIQNNNIIEMTLTNTEEVKDIYFLDNTFYTDEFGFKHYNGEFNELNESNVDLYINDLKTKFKKHLVFSRANYKIKMIIKTTITNCKNMFNGCSNLTKIDLSSFDTKNVTDMSGMFSGCENLRNLDLSSLNTEKVTDMSYMFSECYSLENIDLSSFNTKNVTNMKGMFFNCFHFLLNPITLNLSSFDTRNVRNMENMFFDCENIGNIIFSPSFNTINVKSMSKMFNRCKKLVNLNLSSFDTRNVTNMEAMFEHCDSLETLDLSSFNTKNVENMYAMFFCCGNLICLDLSNFDTRKVINMGEMFHSCTNMVSLNLSSFNTNKVIKTKGIFDFCDKLDNVIFNNNGESSLIKKLYAEKKKHKGPLDRLPNNLLFVIDPSSGNRFMMLPNPNKNMQMNMVPVQFVKKGPFPELVPANQAVPAPQVVPNLFPGVVPDVAPHAHVLRKLVPPPIPPVAAGPNIVPHVVPNTFPNEIPGNQIPNSSSSKFINSNYN